MSDTGPTSDGETHKDDAAPASMASAAAPAAYVASSSPRALPEKRRSGTPWLLIGVTLAFVSGIAAAIVAYPRIASWRGPAATPQTVTAPAPAPSRGTVANSQPLDAARQDLLGMRMTELEDRLARISVAAQGASGNATRAEGLLVAFAARRALDSGAPLGYIEGQLRLRFGQAQPRAVATIINAAREPVTLADLQGGFADMAPSLSVSPPGTDWWTAFRQEARNLVIIRKTTTPSPLPERTIPRIQKLLASGRIAPAMEEVARLPGGSVAARWLDMARRYREARRALDLIETAAILESPPVAATTVSPPPVAVPTIIRPATPTPVE